jgi:hypothetical protein
MTGAGPTGHRPQSPEGTTPPTPAPSAAIQRANRMNAANMFRSLAPLVVICLVIVGWTALRQSQDAGVRVVDPSSTVQLAAARASYALVAPQGLPDDFRTTSARTDAGEATEGDPVTLQIGYLTPEEEFAGFVVSDDPRAEAVAAVLDGATGDGTVDVDGTSWTRSTTEGGETALSRDDDGVIVIVSGSASEEELEAVAAAVRPWSA